MRKLNIYKPYIDGFAGFWAWQDEELVKKIKEIEIQNNCTVYAVTHEFTSFGECYDFLIVTDYKDDWEYLLTQADQGFYAIHYFEEDAIEGKLYNLDGTEYKPAVKEPVKTVEPVKEKPKPQDQQASIFDILDGPFNVPVNIPNFNKFEPKAEEQPASKVEIKTEPKQENGYLFILNEILGGIVKEY